jgi:hypothetical protein
MAPWMAWMAGRNREFNEETLKRSKIVATLLKNIMEVSDFSDYWSLDRWTYLRSGFTSDLKIFYTKALDFRSIGRY